MSDKLDEAARIIHTQILFQESASFKEIKRAVQLIAQALKENADDRT